MTVTDDIKARLDIVDLIAQYAPDLRSSGRNFSARCPFHQERTPSFIVFPDRQTWHCFGACATGGDAFSFVMRIEELDFPSAVKHLAKRVGITVPELRATSQKQNPIFDVNKRAIRFFTDALNKEQGALARSYLKQRGVNETATARFEIGYSPSTGSELFEHMVGIGYSQELLAEAGLITRSDSGPQKDMFRGRLMFPIFDHQGNPVGFGGRSMDGSSPKYLNTPQTSAFDKSRTLYAMNWAKTALSAGDDIVVVEGYMDAIAAHEHGFENVVASMGTALTGHQVELLTKYAQSFVLALDPDTAGQEATLRSLKSSWNIILRWIAVSSKNQSRNIYAKSDQAANLRIAILPAGEDPDALIRRDPSLWSDLLRSAKPSVEYFIEATLDRLDMTSDKDKAVAVEDLFPLITGITNPFEQDRYVQKLADRLGVSRAVLQTSARKLQVQSIRRRPRSEAKSASFSEPNARNSDVLEEYILTLMVQNPDLAQRSDELKMDYFTGADTRQVLSAIIEADTMDGVYDLLDANVTLLLERLVVRALPPADRLQRSADFEACKYRLEERHLRGLKAQEESALAQATEAPIENPSHLDSVHKQSNEINERLKQLFSGNSP